MLPLRIIGFILTLLILHRPYEYRVENDDQEEEENEELAA